MQLSRTRTVVQPPLGAKQVYNATMHKARRAYLLSLDPLGRRVLRDEAREATGETPYVVLPPEVEVYPPTRSWQRRHNALSRRQAALTIIYHLPDHLVTVAQ